MHRPKTRLAQSSTRLSRRSLTKWLQFLSGSFLIRIALPLNELHLYRRTRSYRPPVEDALEQIINKTVPPPQPGNTTSGSKRLTNTKKNSAQGATTTKGADGKGAKKSRVRYYNPPLTNTARYISYSHPSSVLIHLSSHPGVFLHKIISESARTAAPETSLRPSGKPLVTKRRMYVPSIPFLYLHLYILIALGKSEGGVCGQCFSRRYGFVCVARPSLTPCSSSIQPGTCYHGMFTCCIHHHSHLTFSYLG